MNRGLHSIVDPTPTRVDQEPILVLAKPIFVASYGRDGAFPNIEPEELLHGQGLRNVGAFPKNTASSISM